MVSPKRKRIIAGMVAGGAVALLVVGRGGKCAWVEHVSNSALFFCPFLLIHRGFWKRVFLHPAFWPALGLGGWYSLSGLRSPAPVAAWSAITGLWSVLALTVVGLSTWREADRRRLDYFFAGVVCLQTVLLIGETVFGFRRFLVFPGNEQYASFWSCAVFFLSLSRLFPTGETLFPKSAVRWGWFGVSLLAATGAVLLPVRSGLFALLAGLFVFGSIRFGWRGVLGVGVALLLGFSILPQSEINRRLKVDNSRAFKRVDIWRASLAGVGARPLFGWGPGQFENLYWRHGLPQETEPVRFEMTTDRAHNDWLQYFTESGVPGGVLALLAFFALWRSDPKGRRGLGLRSAWTSVGAFAMVNSPLVLPASGALIGASAALAPPGRLVRRPPLPLWAGRWMALLATIFLTLLGVGEAALAINEGLGTHRFVMLDSTDPARVESRRIEADRKLHSGIDPESAVAEIELRELLRWNPHRADLWRDLGHLEADHRPPSRISDALDHYRRALSLNPHKAPWWVEMAKILARGGEFSAARRALVEAIRDEPHYFDAWVGYGLLLRREGRSGDAVKWLTRLQRDSESWPTAGPDDSGYRRTVLQRNLPDLERILKEWKSARSPKD